MHSLLYTGVFTTAGGHGIDENFRRCQFEGKVFDHLMYASVCRIGGRWCCADCLKSPHGAGLHDHSATTSFHCLRGGLRHEKLPLQDGS
jgi:hypothetical protein